MVAVGARAGPLPTLNQPGRSPSWWRQLVAITERERLGGIGILICLLLVLIAALADIISPADPLQMRAGGALAAPGSSFPLGADPFGRDILSRLIHGARISLTVGLGATLLGTTIGAAVALISGYLGGWVDMLLQRIMDMMMAIPALILAMAMVAVLSPSLTNVIYAVAFALVPGTNRVMRAQVLSVKERDYILAARTQGAPVSRILVKHVLPNCMAPYLIIASAGMSTAILAEASLSFLGLGIPAPAPSWGSMLSTARDYVDIAPWIPIFPGLAISLAVFGFNLLGDALRDILDPRLRNR
jgi:peptide/nickel transport system permease protein